MSKSDELKRFLHMRKFARMAVSKLESLERNEFMEDDTLTWAVAKYLENIGEAAARVPSPTRKKYNQIDSGRI